MPATSLVPMTTKLRSSLRRSTSNEAVRRCFMVASALIAITASTWWAVRNSMLSHGVLDLRVYMGAVRARFIDGESLYDFGIPAPDGALGFAYPPFAAVFLSPLAAVAPTTAVVLFTEVSLLALGAAVWWVVRPMVERHGWNPLYVWVLAVAAAFPLKPVWLTIGIGQINLVLLVLVLTDFALLRGKSRFAGIGIGFAGAIKLTPLLFIVYLAVTRRWRAAFTAAASAGAATLLGFAVLPSESWRYFFGGLIFDVEGISNAARTPNQSLSGLVARITGEAVAPTLPWLLLALPALAFGLWQARRLFRHGNDLAGFTVIGLTTALVSPISWTHHLVWIVPALAVLLGAALARSGPGRYLWLGVGLGTFALFASQLTMRYGDLVLASRHNNDLVVAFSVNAYLIAMLLLVVFLPARTDLGDDPSGQASRHQIGVRPVTTSP